MGLFHVLLAITLTFGLVRAWMKLASVQGRGSRMLIIDVPVSLLLSRPAVVVVLAGLLRALPRTRMGLFVFTVLSWKLYDAGISTSNHKGA